MVIHLNEAGVGSEITKTFMKLNLWKLENWENCRKLLTLQTVPGSSSPDKGDPFEQCWSWVWNNKNFHETEMIKIVESYLPCNNDSMSDDDHSSTLERDVGADQSRRTSSAKWLKLCPLSQKSPTKTVEDVQARPSYHPHSPFCWTVPQVQLKVINLNDAGGSWVRKITTFN